MQVIVDGLLVDYQKSGQGQLLVLIHGWNDSAKGLQTLSQQLSKKYQVITPDLPGFGASQAPGEVWGLDEYSSFIAHLIKKLNLGQPHALIGHSNGGAIALRGLASVVLSADKLVLLSSAGIRSKNRGRLMAIQLSTKAGKIILLPLPKSLKSKIRKRLYTKIGSDMLVAEHLSDSFKKIVAEDEQADAAGINQPTLIIYGEDDEQTPLSYGQIFHQLIEGSTLEVLPNAGHFVHQDRPADVVKLIEDFL